MPRRLSAPGEAALAVFSLGPGEESLLLARLGCPAPDAGQIVLRRLELGDGLHEPALLLRLPGGEVELHVHGGPRIVERIETRLGAQACTEQRDPVTETLLHAAVPELVLLALAQRGVEGLPALRERADRGSSPQLMQELRAAEQRGREAEPYLIPRAVVLRGSVNSGKSTLFNVLAGRERVRSGPMPGLTRDSVEERIVLGGLPLRLIDSAGEVDDPAHSDPGGVDAQAIEMARQEERDAALVLRLVRCDRPVPAGNAEECRIWTHADLAPERAGALRAQGELAFDLVRDATGARRGVTSLLRASLAPAPCPTRGACPLDAAQRAWLAVVLGT